MRNHGSISWSFLQQYMVPNVPRFRNKESKYDIKQFLSIFTWCFFLSNLSPIIALPCQYLGNSCIKDLIDATLADEDAFATQKFLMLLLM